MIRYLAFERYLLRHLEALGHPTARIRAALPPADRLARLRCLARHAVDVCGDPSLGLTIGQAVATTAYGVLGHACIHSESLVHAHRFMLKHLWLLHPGAGNAARLDEHDGCVTLTYLQPPVWPELPHFYLDLFFSANLKRSRELTDDPLIGARLLRKRPPPEQPARYQEILGIPVAFDAGVDQLVIPGGIARAPLAGASIIHSRAYLEQCDALLASMQRASGIAEQVRQVLLQQRTADASMPAVAGRLHVSPRTLRRRLTAQGTSFRAVQQEVRLHLASQYLTETTLAIADIAQLLGYFDTPTFSRAFKAWTGCTPRAYRDEGAPSGRSVTT